MIYLYLNLFGERRRHSLQIHLLGVGSAGLDEELVPLLIGKTHYLILNRRAISRPYPLNSTLIKGRAVYIVENDLFGAVVCVTDVANHRIFGKIFRSVRKGNDSLVALLNFKTRKIYARFKHSGRSSRLESAKFYAEFYKGARQPLGGKKPVRTARIGSLSDKDFARKEGSRCENYGAADIVGAKAGYKMPPVGFFI